MRKAVKILAVAAAFTAAFAFTAFAGWEQDETGYRYHNDSGSYANDQILNIDGVNYGFNPQGYMATGWYYVTATGTWYYFDPASGAQVNGWVQSDGKWYYMNPSNGGAMHTSWLKLGPNLYYLDESGVMAVGYFGVGGLAYRADENGVVYRNTSEEDANGNIYVYDDEGRIKFANAQTRNISKGEGGSVFQDFMTPEDFEEGKAAITRMSEEVIEKTMDEYYVKYREKIDGVTSSNRLAKRTEDWKQRASRALQELQVPQEKIDAYMNAVVYNTYRPYGDLSEFGYDYEYEDEDEDDDYDDYYDDDYYDYYDDDYDYD